MKFLSGFLFVLLVLWVAWFMTGGPTRESAWSGPFLSPPSPVGPGGTYGTESNGDGAAETVPPEVADIQETLRRQGFDENTVVKTTGISLFGDRISFGGFPPTGARDASEEYLEVRASSNNKEPINISGWRLKSIATGHEATVGQGAYLPRSGKVNTEQPIFLAPGERAYVVTGSSPVGVSFRLNICSGYLGRFQTFVPSLPADCPRPEEGYPDSGTPASDKCLDYLETINRCSAHIAALPLSLADNPSCQDYISQYVNYNGCVDLYKNKAAFYKPEWRVYLKKTQKLWKESREIIVLYDTEGKIVDSISY
ncbi:MAG: hypothetical protein HYS74_00795 [Parcubacteria group bacterium]|nr:hypothetical protein [Parcubacteria group bacterium]